MTNSEQCSVTLTTLQDFLVSFSGNPDLRDLRPETPLGTVLDSLAHFSFLMAVEKEFGLSMPDESFTLDKMGTLDGILTAIEGSSESSPVPSA